MRHPLLGPPLVELPTTFTEEQIARFAEAIARLVVAQVIAEIDAEAAVANTSTPDVRAAS